MHEGMHAYVGYIHKPRFTYISFVVCSMNTL